MKSKDNNRLILVNMPDCSNLLFEFDNQKVINCKRVSQENSINAICYYSLTYNIQEQIDSFINPDAM